MAAESKPDAASGKPRRWHWWSDGVTDNALEIVTAIQHVDRGKSSPTRNEVLIRRAEFKSLIRDAERGLLADEKWVAVARDPLLWELRWEWDDGTQVRGYFHEPAGAMGACGVLVRVHVKDLFPAVPLRPVRQRAIRREQNHQIAVASQRIRAGSGTLWGLPGSAAVLA